MIRRDGNIREENIRVENKIQGEEVIYRDEKI